MEHTSTNESTERITHSTLACFSGTSAYYRHPLIKSVVLTDGAKFLWDNGAAWLVDDIAIYQMDPHLKDQDFQSWTLSVDLAKGTARLKATDGNSTTLHNSKIAYTDFPLESVRLFLVDDGTRKVLMLDSEY